MTEREKVIKGLECCIDKLDTVTNKTHGFNCTACPYFKRCDSSGYLVGLPLMKDALALLKAQEPLKPKLSVSGILYKCRACGRPLTKYLDEFCPKCGRPVKWDD